MRNKHFYLVTLTFLGLRIRYGKSDFNVDFSEYLWMRAKEYFCYLPGVMYCFRSVAVAVLLLVVQLKGKYAVIDCRITMEYMDESSPVQIFYHGSGEWWVNLEMYLDKHEFQASRQKVQKRHLMAHFVELTPFFILVKSAIHFRSTSFEQGSIYYKSMKFQNSGSVFHFRE